MAEKDQELINFFIDEAMDLVSEWERICLQLETDSSQENFNALFRIAHNIKGSSRAVGLDEVGEFIHKVEDVIVSVRDQKAPFNSEVLSMLLASQTILSDWFNGLKVDANYVVELTEFYAKFFDHTETPQEERKSSASTLVKEEMSSTEVAQPKMIQNKNTLKDEVLRVSTKKIDNLINLIGELSIQQSILENAIGHKSREQDGMIFSSLNLSRKLTKEIYNTAFGLRMTPVGGIFQRLERGVKDLARDVGKDIEVECHGSEVEIEKTILDKLIDPLTHIVRNSVDHGIEAGEERLNQGKPAVGKVTIIAQKEGDGVEIVIKDDGKGLNQKKILQKAIEKGIVKNPENLSQEEIFGLIFLPGFSTAEKVTNISGRGVGMDVVMRTIEEVEGKILIASEEGKGTKFKIIIPTSLSIVESLIVQVDKASYVLPINCLEEVLEVAKNDLKKEQSIYNYRGQVIPFLHLSDIFCERERSLQFKTVSVLIAKAHGKRIALGVDSIIGQHQSVVRSLSSYFDQSFALSGGTILPSGEPGLILNINAIIEKYFKYIVKTSEVAA